MFRKIIASTAIVGSLALAACDVESVVNDLQQQAIDAAFESIRDNAKTNGGDAIILHAGTAATLTITDPASPIKGATITVPADALPADAENVALSIQTPPSTGVAVPSPDDLKFNGPLAAIVLVKLPDGAEVTLAKPINVALPYAAGDTYPADKLVLSNIPKSGGEPKVVEGSKSDTTKKLVAGDTLEPNLMQAVWPVTWDGVAAAPANTFVYKVLASDGTTEACVGMVDLLNEKIVSKDRADTGTGDTLTFGSAGVASSLTFVNVGTTISDVIAPTTNSVDVVAAASELSLMCKGVTYVGTQSLAATFTFTNFVGDTAVDPAVGSIDLTATIDVKTDAGERVLGQIGTTTIDAFSWAK